MKKITQFSLLNFIVTMEEDKARPEVIIDQLKLFLGGVRDVRLHDNCVILIDGALEVDNLVEKLQEENKELLIQLTKTRASIKKIIEG